jgi:hypothetical protein
MNELSLAKIEDNFQIHNQIPITICHYPQKNILLFLILQHQSSTMTNNDLAWYKKANTLAEVGTALRIDVPITPDHPFYTDFSDVRGDFEEKFLYKKLNVSHNKYDSKANAGAKTRLFLSGYRGVGKTSELAKIAHKLNHRDCFLCVICNLDHPEKGLDINDMSYMDIVIYQLERLSDEVNTKGLTIDQDIINSLNKWFEQKVKEVNTLIKADTGLEIQYETSAISPIKILLGITSKLKANFSGSKENATKIRAVLRQNFTEFALKFNEYIESVNMQLRKEGIAQEILFIIDGFDKIGTKEMRRKVIIEENHLRQIKVNTIFSLPIELMKDKELLESYGTVISFPFVKIRERNGDNIEAAISKFEEFVYKRIDSSLFDSPETVRKAILLGGGSPRELLRILDYANIYTDDDATVIKLENLEKGVKKFASSSAQYITVEDFEKLKELKDANTRGEIVALDTLDHSWLDMLQKLIILEYNDGTYKRVNPVVEASAIYQQYVG